MLVGVAFGYSMDSREKEPPQSEALPNVLLVGFALLFVLHLAGSLAPGVRSWGIDYWSEIPVWAAFGCVGLFVIAIVPQVSSRIDSLVAKVVSRRQFAVAGILLAATLFGVLHSKGLTYGDGYSFPGLLESEMLPQLSGNLRYMVGDLLTHHLLYHYAFAPLGLSVATTYATISVVAGALSLLACVHIARSLYPQNSRARWLLVAAAFTSGTAVLWFGHVEAYSLANTAILWSLAYAISKPQSHRRIILAWLFWLIATFMHLVALAFLPTLVWGTVTRYARVPGGSLSRSRGAVATLGAFLVCALGAAIAGQLKPGILVPIIPTAHSQYTAFSSAHLLDILNLLVFCAPLGLVGCAFWLMSKPRPGTEESASGTALLSVAAFSLWSSAFWIDPLIGGFRDWDLLGSFGIPASLWGATVAVRRISTERQLCSAWVAVAVVAIAHTGTFIWSVQDEAAAALRNDRMVHEDIHYSANFHSGERRVSWADIMSRCIKRDDLAKSHNQARLMLEPNDPHTWQNLAMNYWNLRQGDSAVIAQRKSAELDPSSSTRWQQLAQICMRLGRIECVRSAYESYIALVDTSCSERNILASVYIDLGIDSLAMPLLNRSLDQKPDNYEAYYLLGIVAEHTGDLALALARYEEATIRGGTPVDLQQRLTRLRQAGVGGPNGQK